MYTVKPMFCNEVVYEDQSLKATKIWHCDAEAHYDHTHLADIYVNDRTNRLYMNMDGNILFSRQKNKYRYEHDGSQDGLLPVLTHDMKWLLVDKEGNETPVDIPNICDIECEDNGLFRINTMNLNWEDMAYCTEGHYPGYYGFIDRNGKIIIEPQYIYTGAFHCGYAVVCKGKWYKDPKWRDKYWTDTELWGVIDETGQEVVPSKFDEIRYINGWDDKYFAHSGGWENGKWGIIDNQGNWVVEPIFDFYGYDADGDWVNIWNDDDVRVYDIKNKCFLFDKSFNDIDFLGDNLLQVAEFDETQGQTISKIIDSKGNELFPSKYSYICSMENNYMLVWINGPDPKDIHRGRKYGFIDANGHEVVPCVYDNIDTIHSAHNHGYFAFAENDKWGISKFDGTVLLRPMYNWLRIESNGLVVVQDDDKKYKLLTPTGEEILPVAYDYIFINKDNKCMCTTKNMTNMFQLEFK